MTLDDDLNLNMSELAGTMGILRKPIARFNALPRAQKLEQIVAGTLRYGPYAMFVLLPAFAALLKLLYLGPRRRHPSRPRLYGEHLVFAAHNHAFLFVVGSLMGVTAERMDRRACSRLWALVYLAWSMRAVYGGRLARHRGPRDACWWSRMRSCSRSSRSASWSRPSCCAESG